MMKSDPIIAVKDVLLSASWYEKIFGFRNIHGGENFAVLASGEEVILCLHEWGNHSHPTLTDRELASGNGLLLYFRTDHLDYIWSRVSDSGYRVEEEIHINPNSIRREFSLKDPDGYYLTVSDYHNYEG